jgi:hypothetical protein
MASTISAGTTTSTGLVCTADTTGNLQLASNNGTVAVTVDTSQRVGIGTASPGYKLDVQSTASSGAPLLANFQSAGGDTQVYVSNSTVKTQLTADATNSSSIVGSYSNHPLSFRTNNAERGRFDTSGNFLFNSGYGSVATAYGCRAWCYYNNSQAIVSSANFSSITVNGTGDIRLNFATAMPDANFSAIASTNEDGGTAKFCNPTQPSTTTIRVVTFNLAGATTNNTYNFVAIFR